MSFRSHYDFSTLHDEWSRMSDSLLIDERKMKSQALREEFPDRIPVVCEKLGNSDLPDMVSERLLVPGNYTIGNLTTSIRNRIKVGANTSVFLFVNNSLLPAHQTVATVYQQKRDPDGFLYIVYSGENSFGATPSVSSQLAAKRSY